MTPERRTAAEAIINDACEKLLELKKVSEGDDESPLEFCLMVGSVEINDEGDRYTRMRLNNEACFASLVDIIGNLLKPDHKLLNKASKILMQEALLCVIQGVSEAMNTKKDESEKQSN